MIQTTFEVIKYNNDNNNGFDSNIDYNDNTILDLFKKKGTTEKK